MKLLVSRADLALQNLKCCHNSVEISYKCFEESSFPLFLAFSMRPFCGTSVAAKLHGNNLEFVKNEF